MLGLSCWCYWYKIWRPPYVQYYCYSQPHFSFITPFFVDQQKGAFRFIFWPFQEFRTFTCVADSTWAEAFLRDGDWRWVHPNSPITCHLVQSHLYPLTATREVLALLFYILVIHICATPNKDVLRRSLMHHLDSALVPVVLVSFPPKNILSKTLQAFPSAFYVKVSRALAIGAIPFSPATKTSDVRKRFDNTGLFWQPHLAYISQGGGDSKGFGIWGWHNRDGHCDATGGHQNGNWLPENKIWNLVSHIQVRDDAKVEFKKGGRLAPVKEVLTKVESAFNAMVNRWTNSKLTRERWKKVKWRWTWSLCHWICGPQPCENRPVEVEVDQFKLKKKLKTKLIFTQSQKSWCASCLGIYWTTSWRNSSEQKIIGPHLVCKRSTSLICTVRCSVPTITQRSPILPIHTQS